MRLGAPVFERECEEAVQVVIRGRLLWWEWSVVAGGTVTDHGLSFTLRGAWRDASYWSGVRVFHRRLVRLRRG